MKCFCNVRNAIPYIQDIEIINVFRGGVSDIKTIEEITMKKLKTMSDLLIVLTCASRPSRLEPGSLNYVARGPRRSRTIRRSTQLTTGIAEIMETANITGIASSNPQIRMRRDCYIAMLM
jgi:hypothetical protein